VEPTPAAPHTSSSENPWTSERTDPTFAAGTDFNSDGLLDLVYYADQFIVKLAREP